ncbi:MAG: hypothetical protein K2Y01_03410 [Rhabdochlamydiaceae bacterium]|nr:hypothetical protein [Rhabdochlamydiaceae bacterium]
MKLQLPKKTVLAFAVILGGLFFQKGFLTSGEEISMFHWNISLGGDGEENLPVRDQIPRAKIKAPIKRFRFLKAQVDLKWDVPYTASELETAASILQQPLYFLGSGRQCYAFVTEDDQFVVKISRKKRESRKESDFFKYLNAFQLLSYESQIVFLHLTSAHQLSTSLKIVDDLGISHSFQADDLVFYIQKKLTPFSSCFSSFSHLETRVLVDDLLNLCLDTCRKSVEMHDIDWTNIGCRQGKCFWLDVGGIHKMEPVPHLEEQKLAFMRVVARIKRRGQALDPNFASLIEEMLPEKLEQF